MLSFGFATDLVNTPLVKLIRLIFGYCEACKKWFKYPYKGHIGTMYLEDENNYREVCKDCHKEFESYVKAQWDEYNNERGC